MFEGKIVNLLVPGPSSGKQSLGGFSLLAVGTVFLRQDGQDVEEGEEGLA